ncbi:ATP-binding cassette domain-containing protein [Bifidobacterium longum subsp. infantis]|uniref:ATP-binding cassette domain-containing protein n=1 Tax=Bifidobacterium longum TaxID=216816 RepID=UPI0040348EED
MSKSFADTTVLDGLDLDIPRQNVVTVIGPSGSGKSTLLRILDFLEHADSGTVDFGDGLVDLRVKGQKVCPESRIFTD